MFLEPDAFRTVVASTPLVSIDLVLRRADGAILLGQRNNRPAQGFWFVPGGRIYKNETLEAAFQRITLGELGHAFGRDQGQLLGVYEHFYPDSVFGNSGQDPDTHYVVLGYLLNVDEAFSPELPADQHQNYRWWQPRDISASAVVHDNTRAYLAAIG